MASRKTQLNRRLAHGIEHLEDRRVLALSAAMIEDINTSSSFNSGNSDPSGFVAVGERVYFAASTLNEGRELWKSDGTPAGTQLVKNINSFGSSSNPVNLTNVNGVLYFIADDGTAGVELWKTNGTPAGTVLVKDLPDPPLVTPARDFTAIGNRLFFVRDGGSFSSTHELWVTNGTAAGTIKLKDFDAMSAEGGVAAYNGELYFAAQLGNDGMELWKSDGTVEGTTLFADIQPSEGFAFSSFPKHLTVVNNTLYFSATTQDKGTGLWKTNGTLTGTVRVRDIAPDTAGSFPTNLTNVNGTLFFTTNIGGSNYQLYKSGGTAANTVQVKDFGAPQGFGGTPPSEFTSVGSMLFFSAYSTNEGNAELWKSNGTEAGTAVVKDIVEGAGSSTPQYLTNVSGRLFFRTQDDNLWTSDGTEPGTTILVDAPALGFGETPTKDMAVANSVLYFAMSDTTHARELWRADRSRQPVITVPAQATYTENAAPVVLAPQGTISDSDSPHFSTGRLTVAVVANATTVDRLLIRNQTPGVGRIGVSGASVTYGGTPIGTFSGGTGTPLVVVLNANARFAATQALLRNILFRVGGDNPSTLPRSVRFTLTDGDGASSVPRTMTVNVVAVNDAPQLTGGGTIGYGLNTMPAVRLAATAVVSDADSADFAGGRLLVRITSGDDTGNRLFVGGPFTLTGTEVRLNGVLIGTRALSGNGLNDLAIDLTASASRSTVQSLLRAIRFRTINSASTAQRVIQFSLTDGDGGTSGFISTTVNMT